MKDYCNIGTLTPKQIKHIPSLEKIKELVEKESTRAEDRYVPLFEDDDLLDFSKAILYGIKNFFEEIEGIAAMPLLRDVMNYIFNRIPFKIDSIEHSNTDPIEYTLWIVPMNNYGIIIKERNGVPINIHCLSYPEKFIDKVLKTLSSVCPNCANGTPEFHVIPEGSTVSNTFHCDYCDITVRKEYTFKGFSEA